MDGPYDYDDPPGFWRSSEDTPSVRLWESERRGEIAEQFGSFVYGRTPAGGGLGDFVQRRRTTAADGATRIEATLTMEGPSRTMQASLLLHLPSDAGPARPVPAFLGLNSQGNHATVADSEVGLSRAAGRIAAAHGEQVSPRGAEGRRWPYSLILGRGYAVATLWYEELEVDLPGFAAQGVRGLFGDPDARSADSWGAIGGWAWGLSRALDALAMIPEVASSAVIAVGHSRLGKTALWAAAQDRRFAGVVSNDSGCGGASLFRHRGVEDIAVITSVRPHWFGPNLAAYRNADDRLPVDQHLLLALLAPRPAHVGSASRDPGADPRGEFLSTVHATPMFELYGHRGTVAGGSTKAGTDVDARAAQAVPTPPPGVRWGGTLSYHLREGGARSSRRGLAPHARLRG